LSRRHDALSARIIQKLGFETYFIGGFPAVGARYGVPDVGLKGFGEIAACVRDIMAACDLPVFVDGDDGYATSRTWCTPCRATSAWASARS